MCVAVQFRSFLTQLKKLQAMVFVQAGAVGAGITSRITARQTQTGTCIVVHCSCMSASSWCSICVHCKLLYVAALLAVLLRTHFSCTTVFPNLTGFTEYRTVL